MKKCTYSKCQKPDAMHSCPYQLRNQLSVATPPKEAEDENTL